jgi:2-methylcitrate dehydratase PrpD
VTAFSAELYERAVASADDERVAHIVDRCLVDWAGCALAGSRHEIAAALRPAEAMFGTSDDCTVVGWAGRSGQLFAALVNGTTSHVLDYDDVHPRMTGHPGVVVFPALIALAEARHLSGRQVVRGASAGYEIGAQLGRLAQYEPERRGWHPTSILGGISAATACAAALDWSAEDGARAISLAATSASGVRAMFGTHGKGFHAGRAAMVGLLSFGLVENGLRPADEGLAGEAGMLHATIGATESDLAKFEIDPAAPPAILGTALKYHAACGATHSTIDTVHQLVSEARLQPDDIVSIDATVHYLAMVAAGNPNPRTGLEAKFSVRHLAALAATRYPITPDEITDERFTDDVVEELRGRTTIHVDDTYRYEEAMPAQVVITTRDGRNLTAFTSLPKGRPSNPIEDDELSHKFLALASGSLDPEQAGRALAALWELTSSDDAAPAIRHLSATS